MKQTIIEEVRAFSRWYTRIIGLLDGHILDSSFSLPEARVLYEMYHREGIQAGEMTALLGIDKGYLSRMLDQFSRKSLIVRKRSLEDGRVQHLFLTAKGRAAFESLDRASIAQVKRLLAPLAEEDRSRLVLHMHEIQKIITQYGHA
ncbi:MarR family winged helix-turn-helix transcriptional regulator [Flavitalea sp. BT771]|uniref:MarR family winged helix-turn-helix transcriptional regulator n=1 Tax=Flavitalea sp. BT771 TaxID=3063329 RepID=UPI0026E36FBD|nr:MarR family winged helix-turn-helix transcriptional regulator [Flavitalea sp. BT771]MDO6434964.1 MarR family winged helix-turn-helix transcriptional regulator [Flavitalea sp. BT771]MDV6223864.1 MarR family winged helix-turn-helix transcriptional regulator [Flavitalea sp. BT771]